MITRTKHRKEKPKTNRKIPKTNNELQTTQYEKPHAYTTEYEKNNELQTKKKLIKTQGYAQCIAT